MTTEVEGLSAKITGDSTAYRNAIARAEKQLDQFIRDQEALRKALNRAGVSLDMSGQDFAGVARRADGLVSVLQRVQTEAIGAGTAASRSGARLSGLGRAVRSLRGQAGQASMQLQDMAVQFAAGTNATIVLGQQLPQLTSAFGRHGQILGAVLSLIPLVGLAFAALNKRVNETKDLIEELNEETTELENKRLGELFGGQSDLGRAYAERRRLNKEILALEQEISESLKLNAGIASGYTETLRRQLDQQKELLAGINEEIAAREQANEDYRQTVEHVTAFADMENQAAENARKAARAIRMQRIEMQKARDAAREAAQAFMEYNRHNQRFRGEEVVMGQSVTPASNAYNPDPYGFLNTGESSGGSSSSGGGAGGGTSDLQNRLDSLREAMMTERELILQEYETRKQLLIEAKQAELLKEQEFQELALEAQRRYQEAKTQLVEAEKRTTLEAYSSLFGNLTTLFRKQSGEMTGIAKAAAIAQGLINSYLAYTEVLKDPALNGQPFLRQVLAASTLAAGLAQVANIRSVSSSGGGGGGGAGGGGGSAGPTQGRADSLDVSLQISAVGGTEPVFAEEITRMVLENIRDRYGDREVRFR